VVLVSDALRAVEQREGRSIETVDQAREVPAGARVTAVAVRWDSAGRPGTSPATCRQRSPAPAARRGSVQGRSVGTSTDSGSQS
jgi:hypothetical protein